MLEKPPELHIAEAPIEDFQSVEALPEKDIAVKKTMTEKLLSAWQARDTLPVSKEVKVGKLERRATDHLFDADGNPRKLRELPDQTVALLSNKEFMDEMDTREEWLSSDPTEQQGSLQRLKDEAMASDPKRLPHT